MWYTGRKLSKWFDISVENPFKTWWEARKYFKRPKFKLSFSSSSYYRGEGKIFTLECWDVLWKDKFNSPRHEFSPHISIVLFRTIEFRIDFVRDYFDEFGEKQNGDMVYWEYLLEWLYYKEKKTLKCYSAWTGNSRLYSRISKYGDNPDEDIKEQLTYTIPCVALSLNKEGIKALKKEIEILDYQIFTLD